MPLQNRVTPFGEIIADPARGGFMGNRGVLHDDDRRLGRARWRHRAWLVCRLEYKGRRRPVMAPRRWTELFFLDEATALAAGHRPCFECQRAEATAFALCWAVGHGLDAPPRADAIDRSLHAERIDPRTRRQRTWQATHDDLPDGSMLVWEELPCLVVGDRLLPWNAAGYGPALHRPRVAPVEVLTPRGTVLALAAGYRPVLHPSATN